jgi:hypothetical protein
MVFLYWWLLMVASSIREYIACVVVVPASEIVQIRFMFSVTTRG